MAYLQIRHANEGGRMYLGRDDEDDDDDDDDVPTADHGPYWQMSSKLQVSPTLVSKQILERTKPWHGNE